MACQISCISSHFVLWEAVSQCLFPQTFWAGYATSLDHAPHTFVFRQGLPFLSPLKIMAWQKLCCFFSATPEEQMRRTLAAKFPLNFGEAAQTCLFTSKKQRCNVQTRGLTEEHAFPMILTTYQTITYYTSTQSKVFARIQRLEIVFGS